MRDEYLRESPRDDDGPPRDGDNEPVDLIARERSEPGKEGDRREHVAGEDDKAHRRPEPASDAETECDGVAEHGSSTQLVDKDVVAREVSDARERSGENVEGHVQRMRSHTWDRERRPLERPSPL